MGKSIDNYWSRLRKKDGFSIQEIASALGMSKYTLGNCFTGRCRANDETITKVSQYFEISEKECKRRFTEAYNQYRRYPNHSKEFTNEQKRKLSRVNRKTDTFWRTKVFDSEMTDAEICEALGINNRTTLSDYLSGKLIPNCELTLKFCKLFDVCFRDAVEGFAEAHRKWNDARNIDNSPMLSKYDTYWGDLKYKMGYSIKYIVDQVGTSTTTMAQYFKGDGIPKDEIIMRLCDLFDIDFKQGKQAFIDDYTKKHPNKKWHNRPEGLPPPPPNTKSRAYKNNFWSRERVKRGWSMKDITAKLGKTSIPQVYNWFTGRNVPSDTHIKQMCKIFNIDFKLGKAEFIKAHKEWYSWRKESKKICQYTENGVLYDDEFLNKLSKLIYGKVSHDIYNDILFRARIKDYKNILLILNDLDYEDYGKLVKMIPEE